MLLKTQIVALVDSVQQVLDMLVKDVVAIKPGAFIKGLKFLDQENFDIWKGRRATFNLNNWVIPEKLNITDYTIRTPWFSQPISKVYNSTEINELLVGEKYKQLKEDDESVYGWNDVGWASFKLHEPIGVHLGIYKLAVDSVSNAILFYTKILRNDGKVGFISFSTKNIEENELELL